MPMVFKHCLRWIIAVVLVGLPTSYLFWQWRFEEHQMLNGLSYEAFQARFSDASAPAFWTYALYILLTIAIVLAAVQLVAWLLGLRISSVAPKRKVKADAD